jgi:TolB-like protein
MTRLGTLILCCSVLTMVPTSSEARRRSRTRVALIPLSASGRAAAKVARKATRAMAKRMRRNRRISVVVFNQRRAARLRRCMQVPECVKAVARKLRVRYMVTGQVLKLGRAYHVDMMVVARATGGVVSSGTFRVRRPWSAQTRASRLALNLVHKARRGVRIASANTTATDAVPATSAPLFSRSEAESAANIVEVRDQENPLRPSEPKPRKAETVAAASSPDLAPTAAAAAPAEVVVNKEPGLVSRLASRRYMHAWAVASAGVATLGAGVAFGVISSKANTAAGEAEYQREAWLQRDKAQKNALTANILYGVGGAAVLTSVVLFYLEHRKEMREQRNERDISLDFQVAQQGGGVSLKGRF